MRSYTRHGHINVYAQCMRFTFRHIFIKIRTTIYCDISFASSVQYEHCVASMSEFVKQAGTVGIFFDIF